MDADERERQLAKVRSTYGSYERSGAYNKWTPTNQGFARLAAERDHRLVELIRESLPLDGGKVLDLGCGDGQLANVARVQGLSVDWTGVDLRDKAVGVARAAHPWATFSVQPADALDFADGQFDVVVTAVLFSSVPSAALERAIAAEIQRVLTPGGWLVWYDLRYPSPGNIAVHALSATRIRRLFPGWGAQLWTMTLLPPLARRLGPLTDAIYPVLHRIPALRSHLIGRLRKPVGDAHPNRG